MSLIAEVRSELLDKKGNWPRIARETGVSYSWLCKFSQGKMKNPSALRLENIDAYLKHAKLGGKQ